MKFELGINVNAKSSGGFTKGGGGAGQSRADIREGMEQARLIKSGLVKKSESRDPAVVANKQLIVSLQRLDRTLVKLNKSVDTLSSNVRSSARGGGVGTMMRGAGMGSSGFSGGGGGISRIGGAVPFLGAAIGAFGFAMSKIMQLGRASMAKVLEQRGSAGVAGFQGSGRYTGVFSAAEFSQYLKERRMAAGRFEAGEGEYKGGRATLAPTSIKATAIYGTGAEFAKTAGLMDISARLSGRTGEQDLAETIRQTFRGRPGEVKGIGTELPILIREVTSSMEDAVREGVNGSNIAKDMASELTSIARVTPGGQIRSAVQLQKSMVSIQKGAARGQGGVGAWRMNMAARSLLMNEGKTGERVRQRLMKSGMMSETQADVLKRGEQLPPEQMQFLVETLQGQQAGEVRKAFAQDVVKTFGGKGTEEERVARFHRLARITMPGITAQQSRQMFDYAHRQEAADKYDRLRGERTDIEQKFKKITGRGATVEEVANAGKRKDTMTEKDRLLKRMSQIDKEMQQKITTRDTTGKRVEQTIEQIGKIDRTATAEESESIMNRQLKKGAGVRGVQSQMGVREMMLLGPAAASARKAVITVEGSFISLASKLQGPVVAGITGFNTAIITATEGIGKAIDTMNTMIKEVQKKGVGGYLTDSIF